MSAAAKDLCAEELLLGQASDGPEGTPGAIVQALCRAGVNNPVFLIETVDTAHAAGNALSRLQALLDPVRQLSFTDRYLQVPFDLSTVFFVATASSEASVPLPLRERLKCIPVPGYITGEKLQIAQHHLVPHQGDVHQTHGTGGEIRTL